MAYLFLTDRIPQPRNSQSNHYRLFFGMRFVVYLGDDIACRVARLFFLIMLDFDEVAESSSNEEPPKKVRSPLPVACVLHSARRRDSQPNHAGLRPPPSPLPPIGASSVATSADCRPPVAKNTKIQVHVRQRQRVVIPTTSHVREAGCLSRGRCWQYLNAIPEQLR